MQVHLHDVAFTRILGYRTLCRPVDGFFTRYAVLKSRTVNRHRTLRNVIFNYIKRYDRTVEIYIIVKTMQLEKLRCINRILHRNRRFQLKLTVTLECDILYGHTVHFRNHFTSHMPEMNLYRRLDNPRKTCYPSMTVGTGEICKIQIIIGVVDKICVIPRGRQMLYLLRLISKHYIQFLALRRLLRQLVFFLRFSFGHNNRRRHILALRACFRLRRSNHDTLFQKHRSLEAILIHICYIIFNPYYTSASD